MSSGQNTTHRMMSLGNIPVLSPSHGAPDAAIPPRSPSPSGSRSPDDDSDITIRSRILQVGDTNSLYDIGKLREDLGELEQQCKEGPSEQLAALRDLCKRGGDWQPSVGQLETAFEVLDQFRPVYESGQNIAQEMAKRLIRSNKEKTEQIKDLQEKLSQCEVLNANLQTPSHGELLDAYNMRQQQEKENGSYIELLQFKRRHEENDAKLPSAAEWEEISDQLEQREELIALVERQFDENERLINLCHVNGIDTRPAAGQGIRMYQRQ